MRTTTNAPAVTGFALAVFSLGGCGGTEPPHLIGVSVTPAATTVVLGGSQQFTATGLYSNGSTKNLMTQARWSSSVATVATISNAMPSVGLAQSDSKGTTTITAAMAGLSGSAVFTAKILVSIVVTPADPAIEFQTTQQFAATGTYSDDSTADLTSTVSWSSSSNAVSTISNVTGSSGLAQAIAPGATTITAGSSPIAGSTMVTVTPPPTVSISPNNPAIDFSDYYTLALSDASASFSRPLIDGYRFNFAAPAARIRFRSGGRYIVIHLSYTNLVERRDVYSGAGAILADGIVYATFVPPVLPAAAPAQPVDVPLVFASATSRLIEIVLPVGASVAFLGVDLDARFAVLSQVPPRTSAPLLVLGDSITQGFDSRQISSTWPFLLAQARGWPLVNGGYGGRKAVPSDAALLAPRTIDPKAITYLIGYNDFAAREPLATFYTDYVTYLNDLRAMHPATKIYCMTPLWTSHTAADVGGTIEIESYRQQIRNALTAIDNPLNVLIEGELLVTNSSAYFQDGIHPNDAGAAEMADNLAALISP